MWVANLTWWSLSTSHGTSCTSTSFFFNVALCPQRPYGLLRMESPESGLYVHRDHTDCYGWRAQRVVFMSTETIRTVTDGEPREWSLCPQRPYGLLQMESPESGLYVHRDHTDCYRWRAQRVVFMSTETIRTVTDGEPREWSLCPQRPYGLLRMESPGSGPRLSGSS